jgi:hypothetical protein
VWARGRLTGVVDWAFASTGPSGLAVLFGADRAGQSGLADEAETGRRVDPWTDLHALAC